MEPFDAEGRCLTLLGTASVQRYLFASNRLRENVGASYLAWKAMEDWRVGWRDRGADAFLFAGGGNAALLFQDHGAAKHAVGAWSREYLTNASGLRLTAAHATVKGTLQEAFQEAEAELARAEEGPPHGFEFGALPVVRSCPSTGRAASEYDRSSRGWFSREAACKRRAVEPANDRLHRQFQAGDFRFPDELDNLGIREGASQIAIVHADGNGIGRQRSEIVRGNYSSDEGFVQELAAFSERVNQAALGAFCEMLRRLRVALPALEKEGVQPSSCNGVRFLPLRPIVYGGDDLTFICHGRLGLALAAAYLDALSKAGGFTACAGVLVMPQKFPFARGYALAEELCTSAKRARKNARDEGSWFDFQILLEGATGSLQHQRDTYYTAADGLSLLRRPYSLEKWRTCENLWRQFRKFSRTKSKQLFQVLPRGKDETKAFLANLPAQGNLPDPGDATTRREGWDATGGTPYFDPLDLLDFHVDSALFDEGAMAHAASTD